MTDCTAMPPATARPAAEPSRTAKDMPLEAIRGLAAVSVVFWHCTLGFFPRSSGLFPDKWPGQEALTGQIWFGLINGPAAVTLFFVLSGFVLTRRFLLAGDMRIVLRIAIKRWPRLAGPVLVSVLVSWLFFVTGAYRFAEASALTDSPWLKTFGMAFQGPFTPRLGSALDQGAYTTFFKGAYTYNSSLWTMRIEFIGSFIALGLALLVSLFGREQRLARGMMIAIIYLLCSNTDEFYAAFPVGVALATFLPERRASLSLAIASALLLVAIYLFGYSGVAIGAFSNTARPLSSFSVVTVHIFASVLFIAIVECAPATLRRHLSSRVAEALGALSFPLYLIHVPVLCSLGCAMLLWTQFWPSPVPEVIATATTLTVALLLAIPLAIFNGWWVKLVTRATAFASQ